MKIWYQLGVSYRYDAIWDEVGKITEEQCKRAARPGTEVDVMGTPIATKAKESFKFAMYYYMSQVFNNMLKAEKDGYDAFVIGYTYDTGFVEGREMLDIPVIGIAQSSYHLAAMLGRRFATVTSGLQFYEHFRQQVEDYGLDRNHLPGPYIVPATVEEMALAQENPEPLLQKFKAQAEKAIADGASVIIPVPGALGLLAYKAGLTRVGNATIINTISAAIKTAEMLVDLKKIGIEVSRMPHVYGSPGKELRQKVLEEYAPVFKIEY